MAVTAGINAVIEKLKKNSYDSYQDLIMDLSELNSPIVNSAINSVYDPNDMSYSAVNRTDKAKANQSKHIKRNAIYGVVLRVIDNKGIFTGNTVYVDVPPYNKKLIFHPNNFPQEGAKELEDFEDLIFEIKGLDWLTSMKQGDIVEVEIPDNYPNHVLSNKDDAIIKKVVYTGESVKPNENSKKVETNNGSGLNAQNNKPGLLYGDADIQYSWALTKNNKAPANLAATEKKQIDNIKPVFDKIINNKRMDPYNQVIIDTCKEFSINPIFIRSIIAIESGFKSQVKSSTGAGGLMQVTGDAVNQAIKDGIKKRFSKKDVSVSSAKQDIELNIWTGVNVFKFFYKKHNKNLLKAAAAYNNGDGKFKINGEIRDNSGVKDWNFDNITVEATNYIFRFNAMVNFMSVHFNLPANLGV